MSPAESPPSEPRGAARAAEHPRPGPLTSDPVGLAAVLGRLQSAFWPRRTDAEMLLDLGERKGWAESHREAQLRSAARWLTDAGVVASLDSGSPSRGTDVPTLRRILSSLAPKRLDGRAAGSSSLLTFLGPAVGASAKTLANSLGRGIRTSRPDHRWLVQLQDAVSGSVLTEAWSFHRRTPSALSCALGTTGRGDVSEALLLISLLALWQRRRPTPDARGNRGRLQARRLTPKPVAALAGNLIQPGQLAPITQIALQLDDERGAALGLLAIECALTEAHLGPHPSRGVVADQESRVDSGEVFLRGALTTLNALRTAGLVESEEAMAVAYRIARMRAWRDGAAPPVPTFEVRGHPYVAACVALDDLRGGKISALPPFRASTPGLAMLLPQLRAAGARIVP